MDAMVLKTQQWLNKTYKEKTGYVSIPEDGITGWYTIYALRRALQIELGITQTSTNFGPTTTSRFNSTYPNGVQQQDPSDNSKSNVYSIIQGALWCKGYSVNASDITQHFYSGTGNAIKNMKEDAGLINANSTVTIEVMKALLSMNQYKLIPEGDSTIRQIQQGLNRKYSGYINFRPCDGVYGREMNESLIIALQAIEKFTVSEATGNFGNGTKSRIPVIPYTGSTYTTDDIANAILLVRYALYCNGYTVNVTSTEYNTELINKIREFQTDMLLTVNGTVDLNTWMSLLLSKGNPDRSCTACDTRFEMTNERLAYLKSNGYQIVGRYLTGGNFKQLRPGEPKRILEAGLSFFPIFQESGTDLSYFTSDNGIIDAKSAIHGAKKHGIPNGNVIYFAVDTDPTDAQITNYILPYFASLKNYMRDQMNNIFKIGIYGTRNTCTRVMNAGYAETCFVSDMSTGYSGNMGFKMPNNWNLDQFHEFQVTTASGTWDLDKVAYSGKFPAVTSLETPSFNGHATIRDEIDSYYLGTIKELSVHAEEPLDSFGQYFTVKSDDFQLKIKPTRNMNVNRGYRVITAMYQYGSSLALNYNAYKYSRFEVDEERIVDTYYDVDNGADYRLNYQLARQEADEALPEGFTVDVDIYITTNIEEEN